MERNPGNRSREFLANVRTGYKENLIRNEIASETAFFVGMLGSFFIVLGVNEKLGILGIGVGGITYVAVTADSFLAGRKIRKGKRNND